MVLGVYRIESGICGEAALIMKIALENEQIELKKSTSELKEAAVSIVSILNKHKKGALYFGIRNDGSVVGQDVSEKTLRDISEVISNHIEPKIYPHVNKESVDGKQCIRIDFSGENIPYFAFGKAYMRVADEDKQISASELKRLILQTTPYVWEKGIADKKFKDINQDALLKFMDKANETKRINFKFTGVKETLAKLHLVQRGKILRAAEVLFCDDNTAEIQAAVFAGKDKLTFLDIRQFKGNLFYLKEQAQAYIKEHMNWRANLTGSGREEIPEVPLRAIEEAVVNSLCHRDYSVQKGNEIAFYKDRIEIFNVGQFPEGKNPEDYIKRGEESILRNPLIANTLFLCKDIEKWGSGLKRITEACTIAGIKMKFEKNSTGFKVIFFRPENFGGLTGGLTGGLIDTFQLVLDTIIKNPGIKAKELSILLKKPIDTVDKHIKYLVDKGFIERRGSKKTGGYFAK